MGSGPSPHPTEKGAGKEYEIGIANRDGDDERGLRETDSSADAGDKWSQRQRDGIRGCRSGSSGRDCINIESMGWQSGGERPHPDLESKGSTCPAFASSARVPHVGQDIERLLSEYAVLIQSFHSSILHQLRSTFSPALSHTHTHTHTPSPATSLLT